MSVATERAPPAQQPNQYSSPISEGAAMTTMNAAVVTSFDEPPRYQPFQVPVPADGEVLADVLAAGLHARVRSGAAGRHYTSSGTLPMIPGIDGVARLPDGRLVYFAAGDDVLGTMAD